MGGHCNALQIFVAANCALGGHAHIQEHTTLWLLSRTWNIFRFLQVSMTP